MNANRRDFLKTAVVTAPGLASTGAIRGISGSDIPDHSDLEISDHTNDFGWLNARDCGASG